MGAFGVDSANKAKDSAASVKDSVVAQGSATQGSAFSLKVLDEDGSAAEAMVLLSKKTSEIQLNHNLNHHNNHNNKHNQHNHINQYNHNNNYHYNNFSENYLRRE